MSEEKHAVRAIIEDIESRLLLVRRLSHEKHYANFYELPGGKLDNEDFLDESGNEVNLEEALKTAIKREVAEETGLEIEPDIYKRMFVNTIYDLNVHYFVCEVSGGYLDINPEEVQPNSQYYFSREEVDKIIKEGKMAFEMGSVMEEYFRERFGM
ncbi:MAG: NUDIX hydrolase [Nanoarchaeota archaeon]